MVDYIGLYYPSVGFRDDAWVKLSALYWDKLGRIVPVGSKVDDSDTVKSLIDELGFIHNFAPDEQELSDIGELFLTALGQHLEKLQTIYNLDRARRRFKAEEGDFSNIGGFSNIRNPFSNIMSLESKLDPGLSYILGDGKIFRPLSEALIEAGLAKFIGSSGPYPSLIGMDSTLAFIYMEVLAERMAAARQLYPLSDNVLHHVAISGYSVERLVQVLLASTNFQSGDSPFLKNRHLASSTNSFPSLSANEIEVQMATIALQAVLPKDIANVPTKKIIKLRTKYREELSNFQTYLQNLSGSFEALQTVNDPEALKAHLEVEFEKNLQPQLDDLNKCLQSIGIDTAIGAMNVRVAVPALLASATPLLHLSINPIIAGAGAIAFSCFPVLQKKQKEVGQKMKATPAAYLFHVQEGLEPGNLVSQVTTCARQFIFRA